jgi:hypothetical protein
VELLIITEQRPRGALLHKLAHVDTHGKQQKSAQLEMIDLSYRDSFAAVSLHGTTALVSKLNFT